jgi:hypothetical protein
MQSLQGREAAIPAPQLWQAARETVVADAQVEELLEATSVPPAGRQAAGEPVLAQRKNLQVLREAAVASPGSWKVP